MNNKTVKINKAYLKSAFSSVGSKESQGPLGEYFDAKYQDDLLGEDSWEKAESTLMKNTITGAFTSSGLTPDEVDLLFTGDLLNQCMATSFGIKDFDISSVGLYGACSTFVEGMALSSIMIESSLYNICAFGASSHFCSSQKQYRFPLEYGEVRTPNSQWTVTGSGCGVITSEKTDIKINAVTFGKMVDLGVTDANNMGAAMAPACADTIYNHLKNQNKSPLDYDLIITGDLAYVGSTLLYELLEDNGIDIKDKHQDTGNLIFDRKKQKVDAGGSGCGCIASVFSGYYYKLLKEKKLSKILLVGTGALMSPSSVLIGENIIGIAHGVEIESIG